MCEIAKISFNWEAIAAISQFLAALGTGIAVYYAYKAVRQNQLNQQEQLIANIQNKFLDINIQLAVSRFNNPNSRPNLTKYDHELMANFFEYIASLVRAKKISLDNLGFKQPMIATYEKYIKQERLEDPFIYEDMEWLMGEIRKLDSLKKKNNIKCRG